MKMWPTPINLTIETFSIKFASILCKVGITLQEYTLHKKWSFPLKISSVNVTKSAGNCGFGHIY